MCSLSFHWSASSSYLLLIYGRFCRFNDTTPHRMGTSGIIHLGFIGWGSIVPFSSELVLVALVKLGLPPIACLISATLGNTVGGMTCYYMGRLGKISWIEKYFKVKKEKVDKMVKFLQGKGALMAFFTFLPAIGEVIAIALGFMRSNTWLTIVSMFVGKLIRYILLLYVLESAWDAMAG
jgi:membrane protein YqaA with SNARE-associated domain